MSRARGRAALLAVVTAGALMAAGCGSSSDNNASDTTAASGGATETTAASSPTSSGGEAATSAAASGGSGVEAAKAAIAEFTTPSEKIGVTKPLTGKPPKKTIAWLECELETCTPITQGFKDATAALGWDLKVISSKSADPGPAMQQAIDAGVDFIASSGESPALYKEQAAAAKAKGIKILSCYDTTLPDPEANLYTQCGDTTFVEKTGPLMANWAIADSDGKANVLVVSIPDFAVLKSLTDAYKAEMAKNCPDCKIEELNVSVDDLVGGKVPAAVASKLQSNKDTNYVFNAFGGLPQGLTPALKSAGLLDQVKIYGQDFSPFNLQEIVDGTNKSWSADPKHYAGWLMTDAAARLSLDMPLDEERAAAALPTFIVQDAKTAKDILDTQDGDWNPPNMAESFKKLWGV